MKASQRNFLALQLLLLRFRSLLFVRFIVFSNDNPTFVVELHLPFIEHRIETSSESSLSSVFFDRIPRVASFTSSKFSGSSSSWINRVRFGFPGVSSGSYHQIRHSSKPPHASQRSSFARVSATRSKAAGPFPAFASAARPLPRGAAAATADFLPE